MRFKPRMAGLVDGMMGEGEETYLFEVHVRDNADAPRLILGKHPGSEGQTSHPPFPQPLAKIDPVGGRDQIEDESQPTRILVKPKRTFSSVSEFKSLVMIDRARNVLAARQ